MTVKSAQRFFWNAEVVANTGAVFATFTLPDALSYYEKNDWHEASRRMNNFLTFLRKNTLLNKYCQTVEPQKSGRIHWHAIMKLNFNIKNTKKMGDFYRLIRKLAENVGIGRCEFKPVKNGSGASRYCAKYLVKSNFNQDFRSRKFRVSQGTWKACAGEFSWARGKARDYRAFIRWFAEIYLDGTWESLSKRYGKRWGWIMLQVFKRYAVPLPDGSFYLDPDGVPPDG